MPKRLDVLLHQHVELLDIVDVPATVGSAEELKGRKGLSVPLLCCVCDPVEFEKANASTQLCPQGTSARVSMSSGHLRDAELWLDGPAALAA